MSRQLLEALNNGNQGLFNAWLKNQAGEPKIAWYPSAGLDFAPLFYLSQNFFHYLPLQERPRNNPDLFILTDWDRRGGDFFDCENINPPWIHHPAQAHGLLGLLGAFAAAQDAAVNAILMAGDHIEYNGHHPIFELIHPYEPVFLPALIEPDRPHCGHGWFFNTRIHSNGLEPIDQSVLYLMADNRKFCSEFLIPLGARISHLWWQESMEARFPWLAYTLNPFGTEFLFSRTGMGYGPDGLGGPIVGFPNPLPPEEIEDFQNHEGLMPLIHTPPNPDNWNHLRDGWYTRYLPA
jgi:hypothetical protein